MMDEKRSGLVLFDLHIHDLDFMVYAFGKPKHTRVQRAKRPEQDYLHATYDFGDFFITAEAAWYASGYPFTPGFRFQFERAVVAFENRVLTVYDTEGNQLTPCAVRAVDTGELEMPKTNAYANEIRYFTDCVLEDRPAENVRPEQLETVIELLHAQNI